MSTPFLNLGGIFVRHEGKLSEAMDDMNNVSMVKKITDYISANKNAGFDDVVGGAGMPADELTKILFDIVSALFSGGLSVEKLGHIDPRQFEMGVEVELEHVNKESPIAYLVSSKIAADHISEDPLYYTHLKEMEDKYNSVISEAR